MPTVQRLSMPAIALVTVFLVSSCASSDAVSCDIDDDCDSDQFCTTEGVCEDLGDPHEDNDDTPQSNDNQENSNDNDGDNDNDDPFDNSEFPNGDPNDGNGQPTDNPQVLSISPSDGSTDVDVDTEIRVSFDQDIEDIFLTPDDVPINFPSGQSVDTDIEYLPDEREIIVTPNESLRDGTLFRIHVTDSLRSDENTLPVEEVESTFITDWEADDDAASLAEEFAPVIYQGTEYTSGSDVHLDIPTTVDFDGNFVGNDNLDAAEQSNIDVPATVYYSTKSTESHHFLHYILYYPGRRYGDPFDSDTYEHDITGIVVAVDRADDSVVLVDGVHIGESAGDERRLAYLPDDSDASARSPNENPINFSAGQLEEGAHYPLFVPSGDHAACHWYEREEIGFTTEACVGDSEDFIADDGIVLRDGDAETYDEASMGDDHLEMEYGLQPFYNPFWMHRGDFSCGLFSNSWDVYEPDADRPQGVSEASSLLPVSLCSSGSQSYGSLPYQWLPPESSGSDATAGMWFLDPAYYLDVNYDFGDDFSSDYCYHSYFRIDRRDEPECGGS